MNHHPSKTGPASTSGFRALRLRCLLVAATLAACGGGGGADTESATRASAPRTYALVTTFAGGPLLGARDSQPTYTASFDAPSFMAGDGAGSVYVADTNNHKIRKIISSGQVSTLAGMGTPGSADGLFGQAWFNQPRGVAVHADGTVYVADSGNHSIRKISASAQVTTLAGSGADGTADGEASVASFGQPSGIAVDAAGTVYVADSSRHTIRRITPWGSVSTLAGSGAPGSADAAGTAASFNTPMGLALDASGSHLYVADAQSHKLRKIVLATGAVSTLAGSGAEGAGDGPAASASFGRPHSLLLDADGAALVVSDSLTHKVRKVVLATGAVSTVAGSGAQGAVDATGRAASFNQPGGLAPGLQGQTLVADTGNHRIREISATGTVSRWVGSGAAGAADNGASFRALDSLVFDAQGNLYASEITNHKIRTISPTGVVTTFAGSGASGTTDGPAALASFRSPTGMAMDPDGTLYVADAGAGTIRKITADGFVTTVAGSGAMGTADGVGLAASFDAPSVLALDPTGSVLYVADPEVAHIRKIVLATREVSTLYGKGPSRLLTSPSGLAVDAGGTLYIADGVALWKLAPDGVMSAVLISGQLDLQGSMALDGHGNLYVLHYNDGLIQKVVLATQELSTVAGNSERVADVDGPALGTAAFHLPTGLAISAQGDLYLATNGAIRKVE